MNVRSEGIDTPNWPGIKHTVLRIRSRVSNQEWIVDIAGAQCGINDIVYSWERYEASFVDKIVSIFPLDFQRDLFARFASIRGVPRVKFGLAYLASQKLQDAVVEWEQRNQRVSTLLSVDDLAFERVKQNLFITLDQAVELFKRNSDFSDLVREAYRYERAFPNQSSTELSGILREHLIQNPDRQRTL